MKISLVWLFDHIDAHWKKIDVAQLVAAFNKTTAEIEGYHELVIDLNGIALARVESVVGQTVKLIASEWRATIELPVRTDIQVGNLYLVTKTNNGYLWTKSTELCATKEFIIPALSCDDTLVAGGWKKDFEHKDWIIDVDNKSINHRPDLWSHRGLAREMAALLNLPLKKSDVFLAEYPIANFATQASSKQTGSFAITIEEPALCKRFAGVQLAVNNKPSILSMASRLIRIDSKPIDAVVDITNYVMCDVGQPMHAFDADKLSSSTITVRLAKNKEKITLLDGETVELVPQDMVVTDGKQPIALAGIMGGLSSGVTASTKTIFLESACFDAGMIRKTAIQVKRRTEASTRFEKTLDPHQNIIGTLRYIHMARSNGVLDAGAQQVNPIISVGVLVVEPVITIKHQFIEKSLGVVLKETAVQDILKKLDFAVVYKDSIYTITVPSFRATKDIIIPEDIVEEIGRFVGYENIPPILPRRFMAPFDMSTVQRIRAIKEIMAYGCSMREVYNYALHDQDFLNLLGWQPMHAAQVLSPVSENWRLLATTLIPGLLKNIHDNAANNDQLRFFELARVWTAQGDKVTEYKRLSGLFFAKKEQIDFYQAKAELQKLFDGLQLEVTWQQQAAFSQDPWFDSYQTAQLMHDNKKIGMVGKIQPSLLHKLSLGDAFIFELDAAVLLAYRHAQVTFAPLSKYQPVERDISLLVPLSLTVAQLSAAIEHADKRISEVGLIDVFQKAEWKDQKSITFRFVITDAEKTLSKEDAETIWQKAADNLKQLGAQVR